MYRHNASGLVPESLPQLKCSAWYCASGLCPAAACASRQFTCPWHRQLVSCGIVRLLDCGSRRGRAATFRGTTALCWRAAPPMHRTCTTCTTCTTPVPPVPPAPPLYHLYHLHHLYHLYHLHRPCTTCTAPVPPVPPAPPLYHLYHLHRPCTTCTTCIAPAPPAPPLYHLYHLHRPCAASVCSREAPPRCTAPHPAALLHHRCSALLAPLYHLMGVLPASLCRPCTPLTYSPAALHSVVVEAHPPHVDCLTVLLDVRTRRTALMYCLAALLQAEEGHIYRKFTWGNRKSLWELPLAAGTPVRERLLEYYRCRPNCCWAGKGSA
jgi:hypothetical protein